MAKSSRASERAKRAQVVEQMRREQAAKERRRRLLGTLVLAVILAALVIGLVLGIRKNSHKPVAAGDQIVPAFVTTGQTTVQPMPAKVPNTTGIPGVVAYDTKGYPSPGTADAGTIGHDHVTGPVKYAITPPVGGPHNPAWMNAGVYTKPVPSERAVHDLEHGAVWITYRPNLPAAQVRQLQDFVGKQSMISESNNSNRYMDLSPWASNALPAPIVISSWGYQLYVTSPTDPRLQKFVDVLRHNPKYSPEYGSDVDGVPTGTGGRPAMYGGKFANPSGTLNQ